MSFIDSIGKIWYDGKLVPAQEATTHVLTHSLHYGTAVFEGVRAYATAKGPAIFRAGEHTDRLFSSAKILGMQIPFEREVLLDAQREVVAVNDLESAYIRPLAFYGAESLGICTKNNKVKVVVAAWPWETYLGTEGLKQGIRVCISSFPRGHPAATMCRGKISGNYVNSVMAHTEAVNNGYDEAVQLDVDGYISEGSGENLFCVCDGTLVIPPLHSSLAGITRKTIIELAEELEIPRVERRLSRDDLYVADEMFLTGTAAEVTPIRQIDRRDVGNGGRGSITEKLQAKYFACVKGEVEHRQNWLSYCK